ncbi:type I cytoskeletal 18-like protein, putative [Babesia ovata]|uniref:Type I cytoskeletal 18-like protein, putative n=1 Tax=Babesia ovata TaxID=189622 RepID=A0A2H6KA75_9APIC|nr:type I cytoskeletal 18-like protein, putative [Babesia ovata]GBE59885.1 type I cytoskeletal 18-like protein, putative [Babesia ovata]
MSGGLGGGVFSRLLSLWQTLRSETVRFVDAVTNPVSHAPPEVEENAGKSPDVSPAGSLSTTEGLDELMASEVSGSDRSSTNSSDAIDDANEFITMLEEDRSDAEGLKETLDTSCAKYRTDVPLEDLLEVTVGLHKNVERRVEALLDKLSDEDVTIECPKADLPETIPEAVHEAGAKEKALVLKRGRCRRSQRNLYPTPKLDESRPPKVSKKSEPTDLKQLDLSKETRQLLELDSPLHSKSHD